MSERRFSRRREDFECVLCGERVAGDGYTNHCPKCLTSLHVDVNPGDRAAGCNGVMHPIQARLGGKKGLVILHRCETCGHEKWNRAAPDDDVVAMAHLLM